METDVLSSIQEESESDSQRDSEMSSQEFSRDISPLPPPSEFSEDAFVVVFLLIVRTAFKPTFLKDLMNSIDRNREKVEMQDCWRRFLDKLKFCESTIKTGAWVSYERKRSRLSAIYSTIKILKSGKISEDVLLW